MKYTNDNLPKGYPTKCKGSQLRQVIQDLSEELNTKIQAGKSNDNWRFLVVTLIESGRSEIQYRNSTKVLIVSVVSLIISLIAVFISSK